MTPAPAMPTIDDEAAPRECPLCGAELRQIDAPPFPSWQHARGDCFLSELLCFGADWIAAWNRRAPDEAMRARIVAAEAENERLRAALEVAAAYARLYIVSTIDPTGTPTFVVDEATIACMAEEIEERFPFVPPLAIDEDALARANADLIAALAGPS